MTPQVYCIAITPAEEDQPATAVGDALAQCGRTAWIQPGVWILVSYRSLEEVLDEAGPAVDAHQRLLILPFHEYAAVRLPAEVKYLIDAAWH